MDAQVCVCVCVFLCVCARVWVWVCVCVCVCVCVVRFVGWHIWVRNFWCSGFQPRARSNEARRSTAYWVGSANFSRRTIGHAHDNSADSENVAGVREPSVRAHSIFVSKTIGEIRAFFLPLTKIQLKRVNHKLSRRTVDAPHGDLSPQSKCMVAVRCDFWEWQWFCDSDTFNQFFLYGSSCSSKFEFSFKEGRSVALQWWFNGCFRCRKTKVVVLQSVLSPTVGYLSQTVGAMEIHILQAVELLCTMCIGHRPSIWLADERFTVPGDNNYPSDRVWPGFEARKVIVWVISVSMFFALRGKVRLGGSTALVLLSSRRHTNAPLSMVRHTSP